MGSNSQTLSECELYAFLYFFRWGKLIKFIRGKSIKFGYKNWVLASADGYCYSFDTYCGAKTKVDSNVKSTEDRLPLGSQAVMELFNSVNDPTDHVVLFDNFF